MQPEIIPDRLSTLRKRLNLSQQSLAELAGLSRRQIAALERPLIDNEQRVSREKTLKRLALALRVKPDVLTGQADMPAEKQETDEIIVRLTPLAQLNYDRIKHRYGVSRDEIIEAAPLLFTILAEQSLTAREDKQTARDAFLLKLFDLVNLGILDMAIFGSAENESKKAETRSIKELDVFGQGLRETCTIDNNPFALFLSQAARDPRVKAQVTFDTLERWGYGEDNVIIASVEDRIPGATVCETDPQSPTLGFTEALLARESEDRWNEENKIDTRRKTAPTGSGADQSLTPEGAA